ncbi:MAG: hypothetical protein JST16_10715 [Bdellovibrionales bacterium]|nr:hypothetical protein [Bdellovibrionales bacterium]
MEKSSDKRASPTNLDNRERVALTESSIAKLNAWIEHLTAKRPGVTINRKQLVNWLIDYHAATLSFAEEEILTSQFYDEVKFLTHALGQMRRARARGEDLRLETLLKPVLAGKNAAAAKVKKEPKKVAPSSPQDLPGSNLESSISEKAA